MLNYDNKESSSRHLFILRFALYCKNSAYEIEQLENIISSITARVNAALPLVLIKDHVATKNCNTEKIL